ncbi:trypsin-like serine protease [Hoeflea sp. AS60]|uniref:trypsin-like serine protease n=1 Tax=Hoeflea sp. AS60 TaxID=3135780 RepID=UPI00316B51D2
MLLLRLNIFILGLLYCVSLFGTTARADNNEKLFLKLLNQIPETAEQDPFYTTSVFLYEIRRAIKRFGLGASALEKSQRSKTFSALISDMDFSTAVSDLLKAPNEAWTCDRFEHAESRPPACDMFPEQAVPSFPQTLSFPGQVGRVNRYGYFQPYDKAVFVQHHYGETVALLDGSGRLLCSAFLVNDNTLLTAAHCACEPTLEMAFLGRNIDSISRDSPTQKRVLTSGAKYYDDNDDGDSFCATYRSGGDILSNKLVDLAILKVRRPFLIASGFRRIELNTSIERAEVEDLFADPRTFFLSAGFGDTDISDRGGVNNVVIQNTVEPCTDKNSSSFGCQPGIEFVSTVLDVPISLQTDTCNGDSGGPFIISNPLNPSHFILVGVIARGIVGGSLRCGRGGVYVNLFNDKVQQWLAENIN